MISHANVVLKDAWLIGAAVPGVPAKATIKEANSESFVVKTLDRSMGNANPAGSYTSTILSIEHVKDLITLNYLRNICDFVQVIKPDLLKNGFELVHREELEVTDDVSVVEHLRHPVYITEGSYTNIKVTTPDDLLLAERILNIAA